MAGTPRDVMVVVDRSERLLPLLSGGYRLARARDESVVLVLVSETGPEPDWLQIPAHYDGDLIEIHVVSMAEVVERALHLSRDRPPTLVVLGAEVGGESLVREELVPLMDRVRCPVALVKRVSEFEFGDQPPRLLVPFSNNENSRFAVRMALQLDPGAIVTAAVVVPRPMENAEHLGQQRELQESLSEWADEERVVPRLLVGSDAADLLAAEAVHHDMVVMGVSQGFRFLRAITGDAPIMVLNEAERALIQRTTTPSVVLRAYQGRMGVLLSRVFTRGDRFLPTLTEEERIEVYREIRRSARPTQDFFIMIGSSAAIASLGLILNSPAVIIGAMLIAPLMSAIVGMGLAIVQGDFRFFGSAARAASRGLSLAILVGVVIGILDIGTEPTGEMLSRSHPTLLDFMVATVSGVAAAYALCRRDVSAALPGVAIAVALVPPLATVGLFLSMGMLTGAYGALLLFTTNLAAITLASGIVFALLGFRPPAARIGDTRRFEIFQRGFLVAGLLALAVFTQLVVLTVGELEQSRETAAVRAQINDYVSALTEGARLVDLWVREEEDDRLKITALISSPSEVDADDLPVLANELERAVGQPVELVLTRVPSKAARSKGWSQQ